MPLKKRHLLMAIALAGSAGLVLLSDPPHNQSEIAVPIARAASTATTSPLNQAPQTASSGMPTTTPKLRARADRDYDIDAPPAGMQSHRASRDQALGTRNAGNDLFAAHDWAPPPPPPQKAGPLAAPTAPPLPFTLIGKHQSDGKWEVFLAQDKHNYVVHEHDVIDEQYKIESIRPPVMTLIYLPLNTKQIMQIGDFE